MNPQKAARLGGNLVKLGRPQNILYSGLLAFGAAMVSGASWQKGLLCLALVWALYGLAAAYNNVQDIETDKRNRRTDNPLTTRRIPGRALNGFFIVHGLAAAGLQLVLVQPTGVMISVLYVLLSYLYSAPPLRLQTRGWLATATLALCYGGLPLLLGVSQGTHFYGTGLILLLVFQMVLLCPLLLAKDYKDMKGDAATGKRTPLVRYGIATVRRVAYSTALVATIIFTVVTWRNHIDSTLVLAAAGVYLLFAYHLHASKGLVNWRLSKLYTVCLLTMSLTLLHVM